MLRQRAKALRDRALAGAMLHLLRAAGRFGDRGAVEDGAEEFIDRGGRSWVMRLDYPPARLEPRYGHGRPEHPRLAEILGRHEGTYALNLERVLAYKEDLRAIPARPTTPGEPYWLSQWLPGLDAISLYGFVRANRPSRCLEVGSGLSTMFARRAIRDGGLSTHITSIDPAPRAEVDGLCDTLVREPLELTDLGAFRELEAGDLLFFDGSHRVLMNSDATVFFLDVLPELPDDVLVGVHDIMLPEDYLPMWSEYLWSEQYLMAAYLLADGDRIRPELAANYVARRDALGLVSAPLFGRPELAELGVWGCALWFTTTNR